MKKTSKQSWQLQSAKARFSELFRRARTEGSQYVTKSGKEAVVVLRAEQFAELVERKRQPTSLVEFFRSSPLRGLNLHLDRDRDPGKDIDL
jgi:prevent-host-death family protein